MFSTGIFWGAILILLGISLILKIVFGINIPIFRMLIAVLLIYAGVKLITGISFTSSSSKENTVVFGKGNSTFSSDTLKHNVVFGKSSIDITKLLMGEKSGEINIVFGSCEVLIDNSTPLVLKTTSAFASINFPDETTITFGDRVYKTKAYREGQPYVEVKINVVFGSVDIKAISSNF